MSNFKIAFIHEIYPFGGKEEITAAIAGFMLERNIEVFIYYCKINKSMDLFCGPSYVCLPNNNIYSKENAVFLANDINSNKIDILIVPDYNILLSPIREWTKCRIIYTLHSVPFWQSTIKYELAKYRSKRSILQALEWIFFQKIRYDLLGLNKRKVYKVYRKIIDEVDCFVTLTDDYSQQIITQLNIENKETLKKFYSITNPSERGDRDTIFANIKRNEVLFVGRLSYADKRVDRLLYIWREVCFKYPNWVLRIVGDGPELNNLKKQVGLLNLNNVVFEGFHNDVSVFYKTASIICLTSTFEGWGLCLAEAQAHGVIPIAFNCSAGVNQIISPNGVNGFLINPFEVTQFANQLEELMQNEEIRKRMAKAVQQKSKEYSLSNIGKQWLDLFNELMSR